MGRADLTFANGSQGELAVRLSPVRYSGDINWVRNARSDSSLTARRDDIYWFEYAPDWKLLYVQYNRCKSDPERPFAEFAKEVLLAIDTNEPQKVLVDLRHNPGGNNMIAWPLMGGLQSRAVNREGRLFVAIGRGDFLVRPAQRQ